jgi:hypothetical protein
MILFLKGVKRSEFSGKKEKNGMNGIFAGE